jgi:hypothetical protein
MDSSLLAEEMLALPLTLLGFKHLSCSARIVMVTSPPRDDTERVNNSRASGKHQVLFKSATTTLHHATVTALLSF